MKKTKSLVLFIFYSAMFSINGGCQNQSNPLKIVFLNTKNTFVNGEPIAIAYYVENTSNQVINICEAVYQARTLKYNMDLQYFDLLMAIRENEKYYGKIFNLDSIKNLSQYAKNRSRTHHEVFVDADTIFEHKKKPMCDQKTSFSLQPNEKKYFKAIIYNHEMGMDSWAYVRHELIAGDYEVKIRVPYLENGYTDDSFVFSIYDRSPSQEKEYQQLLDIYHQDWAWFNIPQKNPQAMGKTMEDYISQYPNSIFVEKALTLMAGNRTFKHGKNDLKVLNEKYLKNVSNDALLCYISWLLSYTVVEYDFNSSNKEKFADKFQISKFKYFDLMLRNFKNKNPEVSDFLLAAIKYHNRFYQKKPAPNMRMAFDPEDYNNLTNYARQAKYKN